jgi:TM2 domain-containing membrane protein YozV
MLSGFFGGPLAEHYAKASALMVKTLFGSHTWLTVQFFIAFLAVPAAMWVAARLISLARARDRRSDRLMVSTEQLAVVEQRIANENKSTALAYVFWLFTGILGIHNFYIGRLKLGIVELMFGLGGAASLGVANIYTSRSVLLKTDIDPLLKTDIDALLKTDINALLKTDIGTLLKTDIGALLNTNIIATNVADLSASGIICLLIWGFLLLTDLFTIPGGIRNYRGRLRAQYIAEFAEDRRKLDVPVA